MRHATIEEIKRIAGDWNQHLYVSVHRVGKRRILTNGDKLFVKISGKYWEYPNQIEY